MGLFILLVQQGFFASYQVRFIDLALAIMQDEKAEDCPEYPVFALFIVLAPVTHEAEVVWAEEGA